MGFIRRFMFVSAVCGVGATGAAVAVYADQKPASGPVARYDMRAGTIQEWA